MEDRGRRSMRKEAHGGKEEGGEKEVEGGCTEMLMRRW